MLALWKITVVREYRSEAKSWLGLFWINHAAINVLVYFQKLQPITINE